MNIYALMLFIGVVAGLRAMTGPAAVAEAYGQNIKCRLELTKVWEARIYRGPPYMVQMLENDPKHADFIMSESHGDHHLTCGYQILLNGRSYRYRAEFSNTLLDLKESDCETAKVKKEVKQRILQFTNRCQDPHARPSWGHPLEPVAQ